MGKGENPGNFGEGRRVGRGPSEALESAEIRVKVLTRLGTPLCETGAADFKGSALPADPQNRKKTKNVKKYFVKNSLILKVSGQTDITIEFSVFFYMG